MTTRSAAQILAAAAVLAAVTLPALAHPGSHDGLSLEAIVAHLATPWHALPMLGAAAFTLVLVVQSLRRRARSRITARARKDRP